MRSILVQAGRDPFNPVRLDTALSLARSVNGHVTLLIDTPVERFVTVDPFGGTFIAREAFEAAVAQDDALADQLGGRLTQDDVAFDVLKYEINPLEAMLQAANLADLVVVSRHCGFAGDLVAESKAPVLVLGQAAVDFPLHSAAIAWDGSAQAARSLRSAAPLLADCPQVTVLAISSDAPSGFPPSDALRYLARHGIKAELIELSKGNSVEETLADAAAHQHAQLLIMGGYGHSRVREFLFGGVTRYFLEDAAGPALFLAH